MVGGTWASARVKPRVAARVVISGGSGSAPVARFTQQLGEGGKLRSEGFPKRPRDAKHHLT